MKTTSILKRVLYLDMGLVSLDFVCWNVIIRNTRNATIFKIFSLAQTSSFAVLLGHGMRSQSSREKNTKRISVGVSRWY